MSAPNTTVSLVWKDAPDHPGLYLAEDDEGQLTALEVTYGRCDELIAWRIGTDVSRPVREVPFIRRWAAVPRRSA